MNYEDYCEIIKTLTADYGISSFELNLIDDVMKYLETYCDEEKYDKDEIIDFILYSKFRPDPEDNFATYREIIDELGIKEVE